MRKSNRMYGETEPMGCTIGKHEIVLYEKYRDYFSYVVYVAKKFKV